MTNLLEIVVEMCMIQMIRIVFKRNEPAFTFFPKYFLKRATCTFNVVLYQGPYSPTILKNILCILLQDLHIGM